MKKHPLTLNSTAKMPRVPQLWGTAFRELLPAVADAPSFHGSYSLGNSSLYVYGSDQGFLNCNLAGAECWRQSALSGSTRGNDTELLGLRHITSLVWHHPPQFPTMPP